MISKNAIRLIIGAVLFAACIIFEYLVHVDNLVFLCVALVAYLIVGADVLIEVAENFMHRNFFDEATLMTIASIGAFAVGYYTEAVAVMLFFQIGEAIEDLAVGRSRSSVKDLMCLQAETANLIVGSDVKEVPSQDLCIDDVILIRPGEKIPADGTIVEGSSSVDMKFLTGESVPKDVFEHDTVYSGSQNMTGALTVKVTRIAKESTAAKIEALMEEAEERKAPSEKFITNFSRYYTPSVILLALLVAVIPPLLFSGDWSEWVYRGLIFLVISCPCAIVLSVPLAFYCGMGKSSSEGILIKGGNFIESLSKTSTVIMDKTGTLTEGSFKIRSVCPVEGTDSELTGLVASVESFSNHPLAYPFKQIDSKDRAVTDVTEISGYGISADVDGHRVCVGNAKLMSRESVSFDDVSADELVLHVSSDGSYLGHIILEDTVRPESKDAVSALRSKGIRTVMLTGDRKEIGEKVSNELGIDAVFAELMPSDKLSKVEDIISTSTGKTVFVGDGMNDAPSLARSDVGIAMGGLGSDAAIAAADVVIMSDNPMGIFDVIKISRKTMSKVWFNTLASLAIKFSLMILATLGMVSMWVGVVADVGLMVVMVMNSTTILGKGAFRSLMHGSGRTAEDKGCSACKPY